MFCVLEIIKQPWKNGQGDLLQKNGTMQHQRKKMNGSKPVNINQDTGRRGTLRTGYDVH